MTTIAVTHKRSIPDRFRIERYHRTPELGPRILFFSGGTALRRVSIELAEYTHNSIHLITPFDSGGSSAKLRAAFPMLAVGDLRNRLMALADTNLRGNPDVYELFRHRLPDDVDEDALQERLHAMAFGKDPLVKAIRKPMRTLVRNHLRYFIDHMPEGFDLAGASIGNLILAGGYLNNNEDIDAVIYMFSKLVAVRGEVRPVVSDNLHLAADLDNGSTIVGQHRITNKSAPLPAPIVSLRMSQHVDVDVPAQAEIDPRTKDLIAMAELIVFPIGSFYTSVMANLLPSGVAEAIAAAGCPKVYVPNCGTDLEMQGLSVAEAAERIISQLQRETEAPVESLMNFVMVDAQHGRYESPLDVGDVEKLGVTLIDTPLVSEQDPSRHDPKRTCEALLSLV